MSISPESMERTVMSASVSRAEICRLVVVVAAAAAAAAVLAAILA